MWGLSAWSSKCEYNQLPWVLPHLTDPGCYMQFSHGNRPFAWSKLVLECTEVGAAWLLMHSNASESPYWLFWDPFCFQFPLSLDMSITHRTSYLFSKILHKNSSHTFWFTENSPSYFYRWLHMYLSIISFDLVKESRKVVSIQSDFLKLARISFVLFLMQITSWICPFPSLKSFVGSRLPTDRL